MSNFTFRAARREQTPLLLGLIGPTWTGKTYSALRVGSGIVKVRGGKLVGIDTEARRMLQYADEFTFSYLEFGEPFSSLRYAEALKAAAKEAEGGCVIVDSQSHEHEGIGGYLQFHEDEVARLCKPTDQGGGGFRSEYSAAIPAWAKPSAARRVLINTILQLPCAFVFCFRAKERIKPVTGKAPLELGWQAIAGDEFGYEMTARCLLTPGAKGIPDWTPEAQKLGVPKRIKDHEPILKDGRQLDESVGEELARWAAGSQKPPAEPTSTPSAETITEQEAKWLADELTKASKTETDLLAAMKQAGIPAASIAKMPSKLYARATAWIERQKAPK